MRVTLHGEAVELLPEKAVYWPREETLLVADLHLGKPDTFLAAGIAVPRDTAVADLATLTRLLERTAALRLVVLGDLLHALRRHPPSASPLAPRSRCASPTPCRAARRRSRHRPCRPSDPRA